MTDLTPTDDPQARIETMDQALEYAKATYGSLVQISDILGDGFAVVSDKRTLCGVPFLILSYTDQNGDNGVYASIRVVARTKDGDKRLVINDGGVGIREQLTRLTQLGIMGGVLVPGGLRRSEFLFDRTTNKAYTREQADALTPAQRSNAGKGESYYLSLNA